MGQDAGVRFADAFIDGLALNKYGLSRCKSAATTQDENRVIFGVGPRRVALTERDEKRDDPSHAPESNHACRQGSYRINHYRTNAVRALVVLNSVRVHGERLSGCFPDPANQSTAERDCGNCEHRKDGAGFRRYRHRSTTTAAGNAAGAIEGCCGTAGALIL